MVDTEVTALWANPERLTKYEQKKESALFKLTNAKEEERLSQEAVRSVEAIQGQLSIINEIKQELDTLAGGDFGQWRAKHVAHGAGAHEDCWSLIKSMRGKVVAMTERAQEQVKHHQLESERSRRRMSRRHSREPPARE